MNGRTSLSWPERIELDVWYVEHRSLRLDLRILVKTARMLATGHGLYSEDLKQGWSRRRRRRGAPPDGPPRGPTAPAAQFRWRGKGGVPSFLCQTCDRTK